MARRRARRNKLISNPPNNTTTMIKHTIKKHDEPVTTYHSALSKMWKPEEINEYIESIKKDGFIVGARIKLKWGADGKITGYKNIAGLTACNMKVTDPDVIHIQRDNEHAPTNVLYNVNELTLIK